MSMLLITLLAVVELGANIWLYNFYKCDFEDSEIFKNVNDENKRKICLESLGYDFVRQKVSWVEGTRMDEKWGGIDKEIVHFNSEGYRGPEFTKEKPANVFRIFTIGGSTTFGSGVFDNQTYPYYLQEIYDQSELEFKVEVINIGWPGNWSLLEVKTIKSKFLDYGADLFIVYDGVNDVGKEVKGLEDTSSSHWMERWKEICETGKEYHFDTLVTLQPIIGSGNKKLSNQEYSKFMAPINQKFLQKYHTYVEQLKDLSNYCYVANLTHIFDTVEEPIFYDIAHVGPRGNQILAENIYRYSLPLVIQDNDQNLNENSNIPESKLNSELLSNDFDNISEKSYVFLRDLISPYKTPRVLPLIFER